MAQVFIFYYNYSIKTPWYPSNITNNIHSDHRVVKNTFLQNLLSNHMCENWLCNVYTHLTFLLVRRLTFNFK